MGELLVALPLAKFRLSIEDDVEVRCGGWRKDKMTAKVLSEIIENFNSTPKVLIHQVQDSLQK